MKHRLVLVMLAACGSSDPSDDWIPSDIDEDATVDRIGAAGYQKLCGAFEDYVRDQYRSNKLIQLTCTAHAIETTTDAIACGEALETCLDTLPPNVEAQLNAILAQASCQATSVEPAGCSSKVSVLKDCLDALGAKLDTLMLSATCAVAGSPVPDDWWMIEPPAICQQISTDC